MHDKMENSVTNRGVGEKRVRVYCIIRKPHCVQGKGQLVNCCWSVQYVSVCILYCNCM